MRFLLLQIGGEAAPLNHKTGDDAMKDRAVVEFFVYVGEEIFNGDRRFIGREFDDDLSFVGVDYHAVAWLRRRLAGRLGGHGLSGRDFCISGEGGSSNVQN